MYINYNKWETNPAHYPISSPKISSCQISRKDPAMEYSMIYPIKIQQISSKASFTNHMTPIAGAK